MEDLRKVVNAYITQYEGEISWKYYDYEMEFLKYLKDSINFLETFD